MRKFVTFVLLFLCCILLHAQEPPMVPILRVGLIADIQYGDMDTRGSRFYRNSLTKLEECITALNKEKVDLSINLGDLTDKYPQDLPPVLQILQKLQQPVYNTTGNHDYEGITDNEVLFQQLNMPAEYYSFRKGKWLFVMLNTNEVASYANIEGTCKEQEYEAMMKRIQETSRNNGLPWNGGISSRQMQWLEEELQKAEKANENVVIFSHHPLYPAEDFTALNDKEIIETIGQYPCVKGVISGHHHTGAFGEYKNIPFITIEGMIETEHENAYGILYLYNDKLTIQGIGRVKNFNLPR